MGSKGFRVCYSTVAGDCQPLDLILVWDYEKL